MHTMQIKVATDRGERLPRIRKFSLLWAFDHESNVRHSTLDHLQEGFNVIMIPIRPDVVRTVRQVEPSLVIIETGRVRGAALDLCRGIRRLYSLTHTAIVVLSARTSEEERLAALESGADEYITDSSSQREIVARLEAVIRRFVWDDRSDERYTAPTFPPQRSLPHAPMRAGDVEINASAMTISVRGSVIETTCLEFRLLHYLICNQGRVVTRDELLNAVWEVQFVELRSVDACVRRLRHKIEPEPARPIFLKTVRGAGYCFFAVDAPAAQFKRTDRRALALHA